MSRHPEKSSDQAARDRAERDSLLETVESFVVAFVLAFVFRAYVVEAFVIPTGSMAPRLNGEHHACVCPTCGYAYGVGIDKGTAPESLGCPMCGSAVPVPRMPNAGDRILVLKYMYDLFEPQRWDVVVFKYPNDPSQNYIKRLVGLPGEKIEIVGGDLYVNDRIAPPKPDRAQESLWMPVGDTRYEGSGRPGRWRRSGSAGAAAVTEWPATLSPSDGEGAWLEYRHGDAHGPPEAIRDVYAYNVLSAGRDGQNVVTDLRLRADVTLEPGAVAEVALTACEDEFRFVFPASGAGQKVRILRNGQLVAEGPADAVPSGREICLEAANVDHGLVLKVDGRRVMDLNGDRRLDEQDTVAYEVPSRSRAWDRSEAEASGVRIGVRGAGGATVVRLRVDRDVYYTNDRGTAAMRHGRGVESDPCRLAADEFFVLGDNSPNSADSRRWDHEPVVSRDHLIGKAFFVYWPSAGPAPGLPIRIVPTVSEFRFIR